MQHKSCFHGRFLGPYIEFMHSTLIHCVEAAEFFRAADSIWKLICQKYGEGDIEFWVIFDYDPDRPAIASCCRHGVYFNLSIERTNLTPAQDLSSRIIEELYHLHEWRVQEIIPDYEVSRDERIGLGEEELLKYYCLPHKYRALEALCEMTNVAYWKEFRARVSEYMQGS